MEPNTMENPIVPPPMQVPVTRSYTAALASVLVVGMIIGIWIGGLGGYHLAENTMGSQLATIETAYMASFTAPPTTEAAAVSTNPLGDVKTNPFE